MAAILGMSAPIHADAPPAPLPRDRDTLVASVVALDRGVLVRIEGEACITGLEKLQLAFSQVLACRAPLAILDFSCLRMLSSLAMGQLVRLQRDLKRWNGRVKIIGCRPRIREALEVAGLTDFFGFHASVEEAASAS